MAGYDLNEGIYDNRPVSDDELWSAFAFVFSSKSVNDSSYKYGFLKAILDNLYNVDEEKKLSFDQLFSKFGEIYWNLILKHGLRQKIVSKTNTKTVLEQILDAAVDKYHIKEPIPYESLTAPMMMDINLQIKKKCKRYVVGALFEDTKRLFYSFSKKEEWIQINPLMYQFICKHKVVIEKLNYYEWAKFLEKVNDDSAAVKLLCKIDESSKRSNLAIYRRILYEEFENNTCFYCGKKLKPDKIDVDHFIPWSFIKDDNLWNLVLSCPGCNRRKKDKLPAMSFLDNLIDRNEHISIQQHLLEMQSYHEKKVRYIYYWARINGYENTWNPRWGKDSV